MKRSTSTILVTHDQGLLAHWKKALGTTRSTVASRVDEFLQAAHVAPLVAWVDLSIPHCPDWAADAWHPILQHNDIRVIATSSNPHDNEAMRALDAGCSAYCHAFSDAATLKQVREVVEAGNVWIGKTLMQRLLHNVSRAITPSTTLDVGWQNDLTHREIEVATLAANGASNHAIAIQCGISERTVKAHLSAVFNKLVITDRLQLALRVHGIH